MNIGFALGSRRAALTAFFAPLEQALGVGERAFFLDVRGGGHQENLRGNVLGLHLAALDLRGGVPEAGALDLHEVADDQPLRAGEGLTLQAGVLRTDRRVLTHDEVAVPTRSRPRCVHDLEMAVVARDLGQPVVTEIVLLRGVLAVVRLEQADHVLGRVVPEAGLLGELLEVAREVLLTLLGVRHGEVARQRVIKGRDVRGTLDGSVTAQGEDATAGTAHVAEQQLEDGGGADDLHALGLVRPADRVAEGGGALRAAVLGQGVSHLVEQLGRDAAHLGHHLGRVLREVPLERLEDATRVLERFVARGLDLILALVLPALVLVEHLLLVPAREEARVLRRVLELGPEDVRRVGVMGDVLLEVKFVLQEVMDDPTHEGDVRAGADGHPEVRHRAGAGEARVDVDDHRAPLLGLHHPAETDRVGFGHGRTLDEDHVGVRQILEGRGGPAPTVSGPQTGDRGGVSYSGLVGHADHPEARREKLLDEVVFLVVQRRPAEVGDVLAMVDRDAVLFLDPALLAGFPDAVGDHVDGVSRGSSVHSLA